MLTFINEDLFAFNTSIDKNHQTGKDILQLTAATSNYLVTYKKGSKLDKFHNPKIDMKINKKHDIDMRNNPSIETINREIISVKFVSNEQCNDPSLLSSQATSLKVTENNKGVPSVSVRCLKDDSQNKSNLFIVAFPFNGMLTKIPEDPHYRIYKGIIMSSVRPFYFNNRRYRKILYLVIEPHTALFEANHKYHADKIDITLESFAVYKDRESGDEKTNHEKFTLSIAKSSYSVGWDYETMNEAVRIDAADTNPLWTTFKFVQKDNNRKFNKPQNNSHYENKENKFSSDDKPYKQKNKNSKKPGYVEGNLYVTTNKHGIRKEVPINNKRHSNKSNGDDLDRMMRESGMFDEDINYRNNRGNKRKKSRRRDDDEYWN